MIVKSIIVREVKMTRPRPALPHRGGGVSGHSQLSPLVTIVTPASDQLLLAVQYGHGCATRDVATVVALHS